MSVLRVGLGVGVAVLFSLLLIQNVDLHQAVRDMISIGPTAIAASVTLVLAGYAARAWRWQIMLKGTGVDVSYRQIAPIFFAGFALNNVLPLRAGDLYRFVSAARLPASTTAKSLAALLTERLLDLATIAIILLVLVWIFPDAGLFLSLPLAASLAAGIVLLLFCIFFPATTTRLVETLSVSLGRYRLTANVVAWLRSVAAAAADTLSMNSRVPVLILTGLAWSLELGIFVLIGSAISGEFLLTGGLYAGTAGTLATLFPGGPGHFGTFDFFATQGFHYGGLGAESALAAAVISHLVILAPVTIVGSFRLITERRAGG